MEFYFIAAFLSLQMFTHVQEIILQQNYLGVAYANLRLSRACCNSPTRACNIVPAFILFYFIAGLVLCAINAAIYFIAAFILFQCT